MTTTQPTVLITGNTYPVKDRLRELGGRWDPAAKGWRVPVNAAGAAQALVAGAPKPAPRAQQSSSRRGRPSGRAWRPCGYPGCNPSYCDECDGEGAGHRW